MGTWTPNLLHAMPAYRHDAKRFSWAVLYGTHPMSASSLKLACDEGQIGRAERGHTTERVCDIVFAD